MIISVCGIGEIEWQAEVSKQGNITDPKTLILKCSMLETRAKKLEIGICSMLENTISFFEKAREHNPKKVKMEKQEVQDGGKEEKTDTMGLSTSDRMNLKISLVRYLTHIHSNCFTPTN
jgi:hypothetical protein